MSRATTLRESIFWLPGYGAWNIDPRSPIATMIFVETIDASEEFARGRFLEAGLEVPSARTADIHRLMLKKGQLSWGTNEELLACWEVIVACENWRSANRTKEKGFAGLALGHALLRMDIVCAGAGEVIVDALERVQKRIDDGRKAKARATPDHSRLIAWAQRELKAGTKPRELAGKATRIGISKLSTKQIRTILQRAGLVPARKGS